MRPFPHSIVLQQVSGLQPNLFVVLLWLFTVIWLPTLLTYLLMLWPQFSDFIEQHDVFYRIAFLFVQLSLICGATIFLSKRYLLAIWKPKPALHRGIWVSLIVLLPLLLFHLSDCILGVQAAIAILGFGSEGAKTLASLHDDVWGSLAYGSSLTGVVCSSIMSFVAPVFEEVVFTGFLINAVAKPYGFSIAVVSVPVCFALVHGFQFGISPQLVPLFFASVTYVVMRLSSGSLLLSLVGHWIINAVIFLPKWVIAVMHFAHA